MDTKNAESFTFGLFAMVITHTLVHAAGNIRGTLYPILKDEFVMTNQQIGIIAAIPPLAQALLSIPAGSMSDRYGAKKLVALSIGMAAIGAIIAGFTLNPWMYIVAATLLTLNSTIYHPPAHSFTARIVGVKDRAKAMGILNAGGTFGVAVGPLSITILMGWLAFTWRQLYLFWVTPILLGLVLLYFVRTEPSREMNKDIPNMPAEEGTVSLLSRDFLLYISSRGVRMFAMSMVGAFLSIYLTEIRSWSVSEIGIMFGSSSLTHRRHNSLKGRREEVGGPHVHLGVRLLLRSVFHKGGLSLHGVIPRLQVQRHTEHARHGRDHSQAFSAKADGHGIRAELHAREHNRRHSPHRSGLACGLLWPLLHFHGSDRSDVPVYPHTADGSPDQLAIQAKKITGTRLRFGYRKNSWLSRVKAFIQIEPPRPR